MNLDFGQKVVYQTDGNGYLVGETAADPDPMRPGFWLIPGGCVEMAPPIIKGGKVAQWIGYRWKMVEKPAD